MAIKAQAWERLALAIGGTAATFAKIDRSLLPLGFSFKGGPGGGKNAVHVTLPYVTALAVAPCAPLPSEAGAFVAKAASAFRVSTSREIFDRDENARPGFLRATRTIIGMTHEGSEPQSLLAFIENEIAYWASQSAEARRDALSLPEVLGEIRIDAEPLKAVVFIPTVGGSSQTLIRFAARSDEPAQGLLSGVASDAPRPVAPIRRGAVMSLALLVVAGEILADSWAKTSDRLPLSGQGKASSTVSSETETSVAGNEKAPGLPQPRASQNCNQPRDPKAGPSDSPKGNAARVCFQARASSRGPAVRKGHSHHEVRV
jgi:hypothetical protein